MVRVLVVDDSIFICKALTKILEKDPNIKVVGTAHDGLDAIAKVEQLDPDIVTLDVEMPKMNGLDALRIIMQKYPRPVIMISSLTKEGAQVTIEALSLGAVDFIPKELYQGAVAGINLEKLESQLLEKIKVIAQKKMQFSQKPSLFSHSVGATSPTKPAVSQPAKKVVRRGLVDIVVIGVSTGGPTALQKVIGNLPKDFPVPGVIVQHMPPAFTGPLANRLNSLGGPRVKEAEKGEKLEPGKFLVVPGAYHMRFQKIGPRVSVVLSEEPKDSIYHPSVDITMSSAAEVFGAKTLAVILTGMGKDGLEGVKEVKKKGGKVIAQDEASSVVFGMPKAVIEAGLADRVASIDKIADEILSFI